MFSGGALIVIKMDNLNFENFGNLLPNIHLRSIHCLLEKGLFANHDENSKVIDGAKNLEVSREQTAAMNAKKSSSKRQRTRDNLKQKKIHRSINFIFEQIVIAVWLQIVFNRASA